MRLMQRRTHDEHGSAVIIAIMLITITVMLSVAVVARTSSGLSSARDNQDYAGALTQADAGVSDALFRIDQLGATASPTDFCLGSSSCVVTDVAGAPGVKYRVDVLNANTVRIQSKGIDNGVPHAVQVEFVRQQEFPFGIFGKSAVSFKGNVDGPSCTQAMMTPTPCSGVYRVSGEPPQVLAAGADVGTNGSVTCTGTGSPASHHATFPGGTNQGCPNFVLLSGSYSPLDPIGSCPAPANTPPTPCVPSSPVPTTLTSSQCANMSGVINPGVYLCASHLTFRGTVTVAAGSGNGGKVEIFVLPTAGTTANVTLDGASLNKLGDPTKFRINLAGAGLIEGGNGSHAGDLTGILYAPSATATNNGCKIDIRGALVVNDYTCNGATHLQVQYDLRVSALQQANWTLRNFKEIPSGTVLIP